LIGREDLREYGLNRLRRFHEHTLREGGFTEYNSPTYTLVALTEIGRLGSDVTAPEVKALTDELHRLAWEEVAYHWHAASRQWAGPHSRAYSDLVGSRVLGFIQGATEGRVDFGVEDRDWFAHRERSRCPVDLEHCFREPLTRTLVRPLRRAEPEVVGVTHLTPEYCLASASLADFWNQRRPVLAYWETGEGPGWFRVRVLRDGYDFAAAQLVCAQDTNRILAGVGFATDGGQRHVSLDRMTNGCTRAGDLRLRFEFGGKAAATVKAPSELAGRWEARSGGIHWSGSVVTLGWPDEPVGWEITREDDTVALDLVLQRGEVRTIDFGKMDRGSLLFALEMGSGPSDGMQATAVGEVVNHKVRGRWAGLELELPVRPVKAGVFQKEARSARPETDPVTWDVRADTWVATDGLGRSVRWGQGEAEKGEGRRRNRQVGIFYFLWLGRHGEAGPFDISKILAEDPGAMKDPGHRLWGPMHAPHHWGESVFGYYVAEDEAVLAKHAQMLADAGIDTVVFDVTNQLTYPESWRPLCRVWDRIRRSGQRVPQLVFLCPFWDPAKVVRELYRDLYGPGLYRDLWFQWEGKPLILADAAKLGGVEGDQAILAALTFRKPQPDYFRGPTGPDQWGWLEVYPQHAYTNALGVVEEVTVGVAQNAVEGKLSVLSNPRAHGRSYHDGAQPAEAGQDFSGRNFAEQWKRAMELDPGLVFVTGWNEWIAGRFTQPSGFYGDGPVTFVDQFNREYSRDIEPMRGGHGDVFYYQLVDLVRGFKGGRSPEKVVTAPVVIDGRVDDWTGVRPEFRDTVGDPMLREAPSWNRRDRYVNRRGRNDLVSAKVSHADGVLCFQVRSRDPWTPPGATPGLVLYLDVDQNPTNGWHGYDVVINRRPPTEDTGWLEWLGERGADGVGEAVKLAFRQGVTAVELAVPLEALRLKELPEWIDFKWADQVPDPEGPQKIHPPSPRPSRRWGQPRPASREMRCTLSPKRSIRNRL